MRRDVEAVSPERHKGKYIATKVTDEALVGVEAADKGSAAAASAAPPLFVQLPFAPAENCFRDSEHRNKDAAEEHGSEMVA